MVHGEDRFPTCLKIAVRQVENVSSQYEPMHIYTMLFGKVLIISESAENTPIDFSISPDTALKQSHIDTQQAETLIVINNIESRLVM